MLSRAPALDLPQARTREFLRTRLFLQAALPCVKVLLEDDPAMAKRFARRQRHGAVRGQEPAPPVGAYLWFEHGEVRVEQGFWDAGGGAPSPDITFTFASLQKLNDFFAGKTALPGIKGFHRPALLTKVVRLLLRSS